MHHLSNDENLSNASRTAAVPNILFDERSVTLEDMMPFNVSVGTEEFTLYECDLCNDSSIADLKQIEGKVRFWVTNRPSFLALFQVVLRILAVPVLSSANKRSFSALNGVATHNWNRLKEDIADEISFIKSFETLSSGAVRGLGGGRHQQNSMRLVEKVLISKNFTFEAVTYLLGAPLTNLCTVPVLCWPLILVSSELILYRTKKQ